MRKTTILAGWTTSVVVFCTCQLPGFLKAGYILYSNCDHSLCPSNSYCFPFIVGERFERGIQDAVILESDEALVVVAQEEFDDVTQDGKRQLLSEWLRPRQWLQAILDYMKKVKSPNTVDV